LRSGAEKEILLALWARMLDCVAGFRMWRSGEIGGKNKIASHEVLTAQSFEAIGEKHAINFVVFGPPVALLTFGESLRVMQIATTTGEVVNCVLHDYFHFANIDCSHTSVKTSPRYF